MPAPDAVAKMMQYNEALQIEVRQVQEMSDLPADVQAAAAGFPEMQARAGTRERS